MLLKATSYQHGGGRDYTWFLSTVLVGPDDACKCQFAKWCLQQARASLGKLCEMRVISCKAKTLAKVNTAISFHFQVGSAALRPPTRLQYTMNCFSIIPDVSVLEEVDDSDNVYDTGLSRSPWLSFSQCPVV